MMETLAIIPARYASSRFPGKPLVNIAGKSMIERVYEQANKAFEFVCVATDDNRIADAVMGFGGVVVMTSADHTSGTDRCCEALHKYEQLSGRSFEIVINVQGDEPFIRPEQLLQLRDCFNDSSSEIATLVKRFGADEDIFNPNSPKVVISQDNFALYFSRSPIPYMRGCEKETWSASFPFYKHIGLYGYRRDILEKISKLNPSSLERAENLEQLRWLENCIRIKVGETEYPSHAIDTPEDLAKIESAFRNNFI